MAKTVRRFTLATKQVGEPQALDMPKRARILSVFSIAGRAAIEAEVYEDEDTKAFDRAHQRHFQLVKAGGLVPEGVWIGSFASNAPAREVGVYHVYEVRGR